MVHKSRRAVLMMVTVLSVRFARVATFQPGRQLERMWQRACLNHGFLQHDLRVACRLSSFSDDGDSVVGLEAERDIPLLLAEGLFAVAKPLEWTSNDVVSYIRGILERDARNRGAKPVRVGTFSLPRGYIY